jgi:hypothetical protein
MTILEKWLSVMLIASLICLFDANNSPVHADGTAYALGSGQTGYISCTNATPCASSATTFMVAPITSLYRINAAIACTGTVATATAILAIKYTDPSSTVQTLTLATATCTTLGNLSVANLVQEALISSGTNVQYSVTIANAPTYQARVAVYQEGVN